MLVNRASGPALSLPVRFVFGMGTGHVRMVLCYVRKILNRATARGNRARQMPNSPDPSKSWIDLPALDTGRWGRVRKLLRPMRHFWHEVASLRHSATGRVLPAVLVFTALSYLIYRIDRKYFDLSIEVGPHEVAGALLGILLVVRCNAGYDRWWEGRRLWGGIVNQSRNLVLAALAYGPAGPAWRQKLVRWTAAFCHAARARLRGQTDVPELVPLLGKVDAEAVLAADHMPNFVALKLGALLREAADRHDMDRFAFLQADRERALLIDHLGGCERILNTPLPRLYSITIRRFIFLYITSLPFALLHKFAEGWLVPVITLFVAYPILSLDQIGIELQRPFAATSLSHLPLDDICRNLERNLLAMLEADKAVRAEST